MNAPVRIQIKSEDHALGAHDQTIIERALEMYLSNMRAIETSMAVDKQESLPMLREISRVRTLRDRVVKCLEIQIVPDEE